MSIYSELKEYIDNRRKTYSNDIDLITSFYRGELGTSEAYNGRQLLELLQNADDARSKEVQIKLDTKECILEISNLGDEFSLEGIKSIMLANKSPKSNDKNYIGNKGLGFRSILNWANEIQIVTRDIILKFSPQIAWDEFHSAVKDPVTRDKLLKERNIEEGVAPFPVLGIPALSQNPLKEFKWATAIKVIYNKRFEKDIKDQITDLRPEILLFLNYVKNIEIIQDNSSTFLISTEEIRNGKFFRKVNEQEWQIEDSKDQTIPGTNKLYRFKVAFTTGLTDNFNRLFTYFPTKVPFHLPCLIHATFDLDPSRNYLTKTEYNKYILKELATFLGKIAFELKCEPANWQSYRFLQPLVKETNELLNEFYTELDEIRNSSEIFPCVDGKYRFLHEVVFYTKEFSRWIRDIEKQQCLPELLLHDGNKGILEHAAFKNKKYVPSTLKEKIDNLSGQLACLQERVDLIDFLLDKSFEPYPEEKFSLLVNKEFELIPSSSVAFTPAIELENEFHKPLFVQLDLMHMDLYTMLVTHHKSKFPKVEQQESREFRSYFSKIMNIQPYDSNNVINKIISGTREQRNKERGLANETKVVIEMVQSLFKNFLLLRNKEEKFSDACLLISKSGAIKESSSLWLNGSFPSGVLTEELYERILSPDYYVAEPSLFRLGTEDQQLLENFFIWLGVNKYVKLKKLDFVTQEWEGNSYIEFCYEKAPWTQEVSRYYFSGLMIDELNTTIKKLSPEKLLLLVLKEEKVRKRLERENDDDLKSQYGNKYTTIFSKPSYINFQLESIGYFSDYLAEDSGIPYLNTSSFNINDPIFKKYHIKDEEIRYILYRLGAKVSFSDLDYVKVYQLIKDCGQNRWKEEYARKLYQLCFAYFKANASIPFESIDKKFLVLARQGEKVDYRPVTEVYYSDNKILPEKILNQYWVFEFPKRNGEEQMSKFFGVRTFKEVVFKIENSEIKDEKTQKEFEEWLSKIKPFILAYRLQTLQKHEEKRTSANSIKRCTIQLVSSLSYQMEEKEKESLGVDEFIINDKDRFIIRVGERTTLEELKKSPKFCDAIAEIFCILFKVNEGKNTYRSIFKDSLAETKHLIKEDSLSDQLKQAEALLGISHLEYHFWKNVFIQLNKQNFYPEEISNSNALRDLINTQLQFELSDEYTKVDFENFNSPESIQFLKKLCTIKNLNPADILSFDTYHISLSEWHIRRVEECVLDKKASFRKLYWLYLHDKDEEEKIKFVDTLLNFSDQVSSQCADRLKAQEFNLEIDIEGLVRDSVRTQFGIDMNDQVEEKTTIKNHYECLLRSEGIEENELKSEERSLLYFEGFEDKLRCIIEEIKKRNSASNSEPKGLHPEYIEVEDFKAVPLQSSGGAAGKGKNGWKHTGEADRQKKAKGKQAELMVRQALIDKYPNGNVEWVSGYSDTPDNTDSLHYDLRYKDEAGRMRYVEVKTFSHNSFILTDSEKQFGIKHKDHYDVALVSGDKVHFIKNFFQLPEDQEFGSNTKFSVRAKDFEIGLKIQS